MKVYCTCRVPHPQMVQVAIGENGCGAYLCPVCVRGLTIESGPAAPWACEVVEQLELPT